MSILFTMRMLGAKALVLRSFIYFITRFYVGQIILK